MGIKGGFEYETSSTVTPTLRLPPDACFALLELLGRAEIVRVCDLPAKYQDFDLLLICEQYGLVQFGFEMLGNVDLEKWREENGVSHLQRSRGYAFVRSLPGKAPNFVEEHLNGEPDEDELHAPVVHMTRQGRVELAEWRVRRLGSKRNGTTLLRRKPRTTRKPSTRLTPTSRQLEAYAHHLKGLSYAEIGEQLGISAAAAGKLVRAAKAILDAGGKSVRATRSLPVDRRGQDTTAGDDATSNDER